MVKTIRLETNKTNIKKDMISYLENLGYETIQGAKLKGKSTIEHTFDVLARTDDGIINSLLAVRFIDSDVKEKHSHIIFNFANKAYDAGIRERIIITDLDFNETSIQLGLGWHIKILNTEQTKTILATNKLKNTAFFKIQDPLNYENRQKLIASLTKRGYQIAENAKITGGSGINYKFDVLARFNIGIWDYKVGIDFLINESEVSLEQVSIFDTKCYDTGIYTKVVVADPRLSSNANLLAKSHFIKFFELGKREGENTPSNENKTILDSIKTKIKIYAEIESNLKLAAVEKIDPPTAFQTELWDLNKYDLPLDLRSRLEEAYANIFLANNLVWLITEIGDSTGNLSSTYQVLCKDIASCLIKCKHNGGSN